MESVTNYRVSDHAHEEMLSRRISIEQVHAVVTNPSQVEHVSENRLILQSKLTVNGKEAYENTI